MTAISAATATQANASTASSGAASTVDYESFLRLLVAQLRNQDPTSPTDPTTFLSQIASFAGVEQALQTNQRLDALLTQGDLGVAASLIGRQYDGSDGVSGRIVAVTLGFDGSTATLDTGDVVQLGAGATIGE